MTSIPLLAKHSQTTTLRRPLFAARVSCGKPYPVDDPESRRIDLNQLLIEHPFSTYYVRAEGDSMIGCGINENDIMVVDRAAEVGNGDVVIAWVNGEYCVKRLALIDDRVYLVPDNPDYALILITEETDFAVWGKVLHSIHTHTRKDAAQ